MATYKKEHFSREVTDIVSNTQTSTRGRYDTKIRLRLNDKKLVVRNLKESDLTAKQSDRDIIHTVVATEAGRPDLIANKFYGDARLYWVILGANDLREKSQIYEGQKLRIPSMNALYSSSTGLLVK